MELFSETFFLEEPLRKAYIILLSIPDICLIIREEILLKIRLRPFGQCSIRFFCTFFHNSAF